VLEKGAGGDELRAQVEDARSLAVDAMLAAEEIEREARSARRHATRLLKTYERLLLEYNGQLKLPGT
jgi:hypothetical protein